MRTDGKFQVRDYPALTVVETAMTGSRNGDDGSFMPSDGSVTVRELLAGRFAVLRYSGGRNAKKKAESLAQLKRRMATEGIVRLKTRNPGFGAKRISQFLWRMFLLPPSAETVRGPARMGGQGLACSQPA